MRETRVRVELAFMLYSVPRSHAQIKREKKMREIRVRVEPAFMHTHANKEGSRLTHAPVLKRLAQF